MCVFFFNIEVVYLKRHGTNVEHYCFKKSNYFSFKFGIHSYLNSRGIMRIVNQILSDFLEMFISFFYYFIFKRSYNKFLIINKK